MPHRSRTLISREIDRSLYLVQATLDDGATVVLERVPTDHFVVIDCSGSMAGELPKIREQLKRKLPTLLEEGDTVSIVWFSGRGEFGVLVEREEVAGLKDLEKLRGAIDRWLRPIGLTGFVEPIREAARVAEIAAKKGGRNRSLFFMSDGCDNQWSPREIESTIHLTAPTFQAATIVEYGHYADRPMLVRMAERFGGAHVFAEDFPRYDPEFESAMRRRPKGKRLDVEVPGDPIGGIVWVRDGGKIAAVEAASGEASIPAGVGDFFYLTSSKVGESGDPLSEIARARDTTDGAARLGAFYEALSLFATRMKPNVVFPILKGVGDAALIDEFASCFGKQKYQAFSARCLEASEDPEARYRAGYDPSRVPREDAFTVLELLEILADDSDARVLLDHPAFDYRRISAARDDASDLLSEEEQKEIAELRAEAPKTGTRAKEIADRIAAITAGKRPPLEFVVDEKAKAEGYSVSDLTFSEERPNVSIKVRKPGSVDVSSRKVAGAYDQIPDVVPTSVWRNYAIIADGIVNVKKLPVRLGSLASSRIDSAMADGRIPRDAIYPHVGTERILHLDRLPVLNRRDVREVSAATFFGAHFELARLRAEAKVFAHFANAYEEAPPKALANLYGEEGAKWLAEQGITDSGFAPTSTKGREKTDRYRARELKVSIKGYSKLPSLNELDAMRKKNKVSGPGAFMLRALEYVERQEGADRQFHEGNLRRVRSLARAKSREVARAAFALIVGQSWFSEFASLEENEMEIGGVKFKAEMREIEVAI